eukprot:1356984-Pleurochrysis_carterae.AAC.2
MGIDDSVPSCADRGLRRVAGPARDLRVHGAFGSAVLCVSCELSAASLPPPPDGAKSVCSLSSSSWAVRSARLSSSKTGVGGGSTCTGSGGHEERLLPGEIVYDIGELAMSSVEARGVVLDIGAGAQSIPRSRASSRRVLFIS